MSKKVTSSCEASGTSKQSQSQKSTPTRSRTQHLSSSFLMKSIPKPDNSKLHSNKIRTLIQSKTVKGMKTRSEKVSPSSSPPKSKPVDFCFPLSANISPNASFRNISLHFKQSSFCDSGVSDSKTMAAFNDNQKKSRNHSFYSFTTGMLSDESPRLQEAQKLENYLDEQLSLISNKTNDKLKMDIYGDIFQIIIDKDKIYGNLLTRIKRAYEDVVNRASKRDIFRLLKENDSIKMSLSKEIEEKKEARHKVKSLTQSNEQLNKYLEEYRKQLQEFQEKSTDASNRVNDQQMPPDQRSWRLLIEDRNKYCEELKAAKKSIISYRTREKGMKKLLCAIKKRGVPVEDIYQQDVQKLSPQTPEETSDKLISNTRSSSLITIPKLNLTRKNSKRSLPTSDEDLSESPGAKSTPSEGSSDKVPKLSIPSQLSEGFHQEFVSRADEFSESWRVALDKEKKF